MIRCERVLSEGSTVVSDGFACFNSVTTGGGGTNTAVAFARLGLNTGFLGKIGEDAAGDFVLDRLAREKVTFIGPRGGQTGFSVILNSIEDDRSILAYKVANDFLTKADIPKLDTQWLYISSMLGESFETVIDIVDGNQFKVAFNPSSYQAELGYERLQRLVDRVTLLVMNREEACKFLGLNYTSLPPVTKLLQAMAKLTCQYLAVTDGAAGAWVYDREYCYFKGDIQLSGGQIETVNYLGVVFRVCMTLPAHFARHLPELEIPT